MRSQPYSAAPQPYEVLSPLNALMEAAKLNKRILILLDGAGSDMTPDPQRNSQVVGVLAQTALSLSTYALAMYTRERS